MGHTVYGPIRTEMQHLPCFLFSWKFIVVMNLDLNQRWTTLPGIFQVFSRYCAVGSRYWPFLPGILAFLENCGIPGKYLENGKKSGIPGKSRQYFQVFSRYFPGIAHLWFSFQVLAFFFPGIPHFFFDCGIPGKYLENDKKCGIPGKNRQYLQVFSSFAHLCFSFQVLAFFFPGIPHFFF